jgi:hypothetical protein
VKRISFVAVVGGALVAITAAGALAYAKGHLASNGEVALVAADNAGGVVAPGAITALDQMGTYLRTLKSFQVKANITREQVLENGLKVQIARTADLVARRPDRLRIEQTSDRNERMFFYDGKNFSLFARRLDFYATVPAPATIGQLADTLEARYKIDLPLVDLFRWGTNKSDVKAFDAATDIGPSVIDGVTCEQYAFRQNGVDWQIWIQQGDYPLPRKVVLTTTTDEARPQYEATYTWNLAPSFDDESFKFTPPPTAHKIVLADAISQSKPTAKP